MKQLRFDDGEAVQRLDSAAFEARRVPLERKVILKFHHFGGFFIEYSANVSLTGMFIKTQSPKPPGSVFIFEIWLGDEHKLVHGLGEVVWAREKEDGPGRPAGMGIRYLKMDEDSRSVIERIIAEHVQKGGEIFDLGSELPPDQDQQIEDLQGDTFSAAEAVPPSDPDSELLVLDEEDLQLEAPLENKRRRLRRSTGEKPRSKRGLRLAILLAALAAALGGVAYLMAAGMLAF